MSVIMRENLARPNIYSSRHFPLEQTNPWPQVEQCQDNPKTLYKHTLAPFEMTTTTTTTTAAEDICYHHFELTFDPDEVPNRFKDVRFVLVAGDARRAQAHAKYLNEHLFNGTRSADTEPLTRESSRFALFKVGPILLANHGMGPASMSIALHELFLMCQQAQTIDKITLIRFGTCGGIGVKPGTICITNRAFDPLFNEYVELKICSKLVRRPCQADVAIAQELAAGRSAPNDADDELGGEFEIKLGATIGTNDFYEEQGRTNGAICEHSLDDKRRWLEQARDMGVINIEMESNHLAAMCNKLAVPFGVVCVALNNRLLDDRVILSHEQKVHFERRLFWLITQFIGKRLSASAAAAASAQ